jgi:hypothetical protein
VSWGVFCTVFSLSPPDRVLSDRLRILRDIWHSDPVVVSHQDPDRAIVAQAEKASRSAGQLDYLPHACVSSGVAALYVFEAGEQNSPNAVTKEKAAEIAADFMTTFYHIQIGALETQEFRTTPVPFWLVSFSEAIQGPAKQMYFVVVLPNGTVVEPSVAKRL